MAGFTCILYLNAWKLLRRAQERGWNGDDPLNWQQPLPVWDDIHWSVSVIKMLILTQSSRVTHPLTAWHPFLSPSSCHRTRSGTNNNPLIIVWCTVGYKLSLQSFISSQRGLFYLFTSQRGQKIQPKLKMLVLLCLNFDLLIKTQAPLKKTNFSNK